MHDLCVLSSKIVDYSQALEQQLYWVSERKNKPLNNILWLLSHPEVITLGASRNSKSNLLSPTKIPVVKVSRGGDITYHDPGQLTGYFIFSLEQDQRDLHRFLWNIEEALIRCLSEFSIEASRVEGKTGVFVNHKKVCSIGIACRHWITYHGFSLNFDSDLENYSLMNPCGYSSELMANLSNVQMDEFRKRIGYSVADVFHLNYLGIEDLSDLPVSK